MKRFAHLDEIGAAVVYLALEKAGFITGTTLLIDVVQFFRLRTIITSGDMV